MRIELLKKCIVGKVQFPLNAGTVIETEDQEAKALIGIGYAKKTSADLTPDPYYGAKAAGLHDGSEPTQSEDPAAGQLLSGNALKSGQADSDPAKTDDKAAAAKSQAKAK